MDLIHVVYYPMRNFLRQFWNSGGPIALKHVLVPFFVSVYSDDNDLLYRTGYVFGVRIFRCQ